MIRSWEKLPARMRTEAVRPYYDSIKKKTVSLLLKRMFDVIASLVMLILLSPLMLIVAVRIRQDSPGPIFYRQERITQYGRVFHIYKFRTMVVDADQKGNLVTSKNDDRITRLGSRLRKTRIDEVPQLLNIMLGDMSFVGTRPEVARYVNHYTDEMMATLLLPAGVTSSTSIAYKDEELLLAKYQDEGMDSDEAYITHILPDKMRYNLRYVRRFNIFGDLCILMQTVFAVMR